MSQPAAGPVSVLMVCTGNICRSPAAELLLRAHLGDERGLVVSSAGLAARVGEPVAGPMAELLRQRGVDAGGFEARQLVPQLVRAADLVLTMTAGQRSAVVTRVPAAIRRTFTLREFVELAGLADGRAGRLAGSGPGERLAALVAAVPSARPLRQPDRDDDVPDPYGGPDEAYERALFLVEESVDGLVPLLLDRRTDAA
jgi:protein-tyrosine phosphatase